MDYQQFIESKRIIIPAVGIDVSDIDISPELFDYERDIVKWALRKGKAAIFAGTGLGKTLMQCEWASHIPGNVLILAPLAVSAQTIREAAKFGITVRYAHNQSEVCEGITITNYDRLDLIDPDYFTGIVLDESSILKASTGITRTAIIEAFKYTPYKLACTATPAPNDHTELASHSEFLGVMSATEMLSMFFVHDGGDTSKWRLKGHAIQKFWEWVAGWAVMMTNPADLGYDGSRFVLPELRIHQIVVETTNLTESLFAVEAKTLQERQAARKDSLEERVKACADLVNASNEPWLIWCNLNSESEALANAIKDAAEVRGSDSADHKEKSMIGFSQGTIKKLVSKPSICGYGMNWQHCNKIAFVGLSDSFEQWFQAVRRCWRFGQKNPVDVYVITAETEGAVVANIERKEREYNAMLAGMIAATQEITKSNISSTRRDSTEYNPKIEMKLPNWMVAA